MAPARERLFLAGRTYSLLDVIHQGEFPCAMLGFGLLFVVSALVRLAG